MKIAFFTDHQGQCKRLAFVQYGFDQNEHAIAIKPHGNSKTIQPYSRSKPSTIKLLQSCAKSKSPVEALDEVQKVRGGIMLVVICQGTASKFII